MKEETIRPREDRWLRLGRFGTLVLILLFLASWLVGVYFFVSGIANDLDQVLEYVFSEGAWTTNSLRLAAADLGIPPEFLTWYWLSLELTALVTFGSTGLFFFVKKRDWFGTYLAVALVIMATSITGPVIKALTAVAPGLEWLFDIVSLYGFLAFASLLYLLPDGRFVPRWSRWLLILIIAFGTFFLLPFAPRIFKQVPGLDAIFIVFFAVGVLSQIYRYWRVSGQIQRQQTKWILTSFILFLVAAVVPWFVVPNALLNERPPTADDLMGFMILYIVLMLASLSFLVALAMAVMRYRLWDIDIIIRRTLVYGLLTALLVAIYFGSVVLLQTMLTTITGQQSPIAIVISTLAIAALFQPLRRRVQDFIDRRFFRSKYDAERTLAFFAITARDEVDLEKLSSSLMQVVVEALQPDRSWLWLRDIKQENNSSSTRQPPPLEAVDHKTSR